MKKVVWFSDVHLGLITNDINRTEEIVRICLDAIKEAVRLKKNGDDVIIVIGGDIFDHNNPSEYLIGQFIRILNLAVKHGIQVYVLYGNHDAVSDTKRKGCLDFIKKLKGDYKLITLVDDISCMKWFTADYGNVYLTFLPHISKARLKDTKYKTVQEYIDAKASKIWDKVGQGQHQLAFSHLNVKGIIPGSEENLLKKSEIYLPDSFIDGNLAIGHIAPTIIQGHIHSRQRLGNVCVIGSPLFVDFGEKEKNKYFAVIELPDQLGTKWKVRYKKTDCIPFIETKLDYTNDNVPTKIFTKKYMKKIKGAVVKLDVTFDENSPVIDWEEVRKKLTKSAHYVKPVTPKFIRARTVRNEKQSVNLTPEEAVKVWLKSNKPKDYKRKRKLANKYIEDYRKNQGKQ
jgi:DNA repair exonuclease SbcCD nuclease subunit